MEDEMSKELVKLKEYREAKLLTQSELAEKAGVAIGVVSKAENGGKVSLGSIKKIAGALGVRADKLI